MPQLNSSQVASHILANSSRRGAVFYCTGPTLCGRTFVCEELERTIKLQTNWQPRVYRHTSKQSDIGHEAVTAALKAFSKADGLSGRKLARMAKKGWPGLLKAGRALASQFFPLVPSELDAAIDQLASAFKGDGHELKAFPQSNIDVLIALLRVAVEEAGPDGVLLIVDAVEEMPIPGVLLMQALLQESIHGLTLVLAVNSDAASTRQAEHSSLKARLQYKTPRTIVEIEGHTPAEITEWKLRNSTVLITQQEADVAYQKSLQGRSGLLARWTALIETGPAMIEQEHAHLYGQLDLEYSVFPEKVKVAVAVLAQRFPDSVALPDLAGQIGASREEMVKIRGQLVGSFAEDDGFGLKLKRRSVFDYVFQTAGAAAIASNWGGSSFAGNASGAEGERLTIVYAASDRLLAIDQDLKRGAVQAASDRIEVTLKLCIEADPARPVLLRRLADVHDQRGEYAEALDRLTDAFSLTHDMKEQADVKLQMATVQFRLGKTTESLKALHWVRKRAVTMGSVDTSFYAVLRSISVLIERDKVLAATRIAKAALDERAKRRPDKRVDCHLTRIAARALALSQDFRELAKSLALEAFAMAEQGLGERAVGNCQYCLGDVYRHRKEYVLAEEAYRAALLHAKSNFDLTLYCNLGLAAVALATSNDHALEASLIELCQLPISVDSPEWVIVTTYGMVFVRLGYARSTLVDKFLQIPSDSLRPRRWQHEVDSLLKDHAKSKVSIEELRNRLSQIQVVL